MIITSEMVIGLSAKQALQPLSMGCGKAHLIVDGLIQVKRQLLSMRGL